MDFLRYDLRLYLKHLHTCYDNIKLNLSFQYSYTLNQKKKTYDSVSHYRLIKVKILWNSWRSKIVTYLMLK